jgi:tripartite motif-containing protein 71
MKKKDLITMKFIMKGLFAVLLAGILVQGVFAEEYGYRFVTDWGSYGSGYGQFNGPWGVAVDAAGNVYVADTGNHRIQKFDSSGKFLAQWGGLLNGPSGVAVDWAGNVYVADSDLSLITIWKFDSSGTYLTGWKNLAYGVLPEGIAVDWAGNVYVANTDKNLILKRSGSTGAWNNWGSTQVNKPSGVAVDWANVYVADTGTHRILKFSSSGGFLAQWGGLGTGDGQFNEPSGVAVDWANVYVADTGNHRIQRFDSIGGFLTQWGSYGSGDGQFIRPHGIAVDMEGNVYVADTGNHRIQKFAPLFPPVADAGDGQEVSPGTVVSLDGSGSTDPDEDYPLTYAWEFVSRPDGSSATLSDSTLVNPSFVTDLPGDYILSLVVTDAQGLSSEPDQVLVLVRTANTAPVAEAGDDQSVTVLGSTIHLDGTASYDKDGDALTYSWTMDDKPADSAATLSDPTSATPSFTADVQGKYVATLVVTDGKKALSIPDSVTVSFSNVKPVADAGTDQVVPSGTLVILDGSGSNDANGDPITYSWSIVSKPEGSGAELSTPSSVQPTFTADLAGTYEIDLVVNDGFIDSDPSTVTVTASTTQSDVIKQAMDLIDATNGLEVMDTKNPSTTNALTNKITAVIQMVERGQYAEALDKVQNDLLPKTDGCAQTGAPDKNDWIEDCPTQQEIRPILLDMIEMLSDLP